MRESGSSNNAVGDSAGSRLVSDLRTKLSGTGMVLICGEPRADLKARIQKAFGLATLYWPEAKHHKSPEHLKKFIRKADVGLLVIGVRFVSHAHTDLAAYGAKCGKLVVLLPRGFGLSQITNEVQRQISHRLILAA